MNKEFLKSQITKPDQIDSVIALVNRVFSPDGKHDYSQEFPCLFRKDRLEQFRFIEHNGNYQDRKIKMMGGIYRLTRSIDEKFESLLNAVEEAIEASQEDYFSPRNWDENGYR